MTFFDRKTENFYNLDPKFQIARKILKEIIEFQKNLLENSSQFEHKHKNILIYNQIDYNVSNRLGLNFNRVHHNFGNDNIEKNRKNITNNQEKEISKKIKINSSKIAHSPKIKYDLIDKKMLFLKKTFNFVKRAELSIRSSDKMKIKNNKRIFFSPQKIRSKYENSLKNCSESENQKDLYNENSNLLNIIDKTFDGKPENLKGIKVFNGSSHSKAADPPRFDLKIKLQKGYNYIFF